MENTPIIPNWTEVATSVWAFLWHNYNNYKKVHFKLLIIQFRALQKENFIFLDAFYWKSLSWERRGETHLFSNIYMQQMISPYNKIPSTQIWWIKKKFYSCTVLIQVYIKIAKHLVDTNLTKKDRQYCSISLQSKF